MEKCNPGPFFKSGGDLCGDVYATSPVLFCLCYITGSILADLAEAPVPVQSFSQRAAGRQPCDVSYHHHGAGERCGGRQREPTGEGPN